MSRRRLLAIILISLFIALASMLWRHVTSFSTQSITKTTMLTTRQSAIVVGSGLAGLSAASELVSHGVSVHLLERSAKPGGNSIKASSGINGAPTKYQPGPPFSDSSFYDDTVKSAGLVFAEAGMEEKKGRKALIGKLTNESAAAIEWLVGKGVNLSVVAQLGGHSFPRTHRGAGKTPPGFAIISTLLKSLKESELFQLETKCLVTKILKSGSFVEGVHYACADGETKEIKGSVIFATGGFAGDAHGMLAQYRPDLAGLPSTNDARPSSQSLLTEMGAKLLDMEEVQVHPTSFVDPKDDLNPVKFLAAELLRGEGGILIHERKRFVNEMDNRKVVTDAITNLPAADAIPKQWNVQLVLDKGVYKNASSHIDFYILKGLMRKTTLSELGSEATKTIQLYSLAAVGDETDGFGRKYFGHWELKPEEVKGDSVVYVGRVTPAVHFTMGGVVINERSEVLDGDGREIGGLWAAGEVAGGVHGGNRLGGSSLLECVVFGRIAGNEVARHLDGQ